LASEAVTNDRRGDALVCSRVPGAPVVFEWDGSSGLDDSKAETSRINACDEAPSLSKQVAALVRALLGGRRWLATGVMQRHEVMAKPSTN
jgi:hypothetical protein